MSFLGGIFKNIFPWIKILGGSIRNIDDPTDEHGVGDRSFNDARYPRKATANIEYWIATDGDDSNPGTEAEPFATIQHAIDLLPKILSGYYAEICLKDGTYAEGFIDIKNFIDGDIYIYSANLDEDLVLIEVPADKNYGFHMSYNSASIILNYISVKIQKDWGICIACTDSFAVEIDTVKVGDNGNTNTKGINSVGGRTNIRTVSDINADKVTTGLRSAYGNTQIIYNTSSFGDTFIDVSGGGIITDGIRLIKADYDDAITEKHTQNTDTDLGATFKATLAKALIDEIVQATSDILTIAEVKRTIISNYGQGAADNLQELPPAVEGMSFVAICGAAQAAHYFRFQANTSDKIYLDGVAGSDNGYVSIAVPVVGAIIKFFTFRTGASTWDWAATTISGTWVTE